MPAAKRRKLDGAIVSPPLSAVAARRAKAQPSAENGSLEEKITSEHSGTATPVSQSGRKKEVLDNAQKTPDVETPTMNVAAQQSILTIEEEGPSSSFDSRVASPEPPRPSIIFSTLKPSKETIKELAVGDLLLKLEPGERLVVLGQFEIHVSKGQITVLGSTLKASKATYRIYAPSSHSLPVIRCAAAEVGHAEIRLSQCKTGLESLKTLSALFDNLWNDGYGPLGLEYSSLLKSSRESSYKILFTSQDGPPKGYIQPLISPPEWNEALSRISELSSKTTSSIMLCGPKSSGKSTFAKILANRLLSASHGVKGAKRAPGVAILDLDPGQPEYSIPGQLSLVHIYEPNFGPPFSHPIPFGKSRIVRSHAIGAISPSLNPNLYMACALDLFAHYRSLLSTNPNCHLVINTPGWILGTGLEILVDLITKVNPTEVLYMSLDGPLEAVESLQEASRFIPLLALPSQGSEFTTRTAAHLRTMQSMSYLHLDLTAKGGLAWKDVPLTSVRPWQVGYSGDEAGISGIICYDEQPPANLLADAINGSLVGVVVIDDAAAIPGWSMDFPEQGRDDTPDEHMQDTETHILDEVSFCASHLQKPVIIRTPDEDLPYFNPANSISLDPRYSRTIGIALIRGIDIERRCLQILTPISADVIQEVVEAGKSIVLLSGKLDTPGWAYTEEFIQSGSRQKDKRRQNELNVEDSEGEDDEEGGGKVTLRNSLRNAPWIERLHGSQGRGVGSKVWRVRRDLGKLGDGE